MRLLLDTHVALWSLGEPTRLSADARTAIVDADSDVFASAVSLWEIAIKRKLGKLQAPDDVPERLASKGYTDLVVTCAHGWAAGALPLHHRDPFDRLLIAQAQLEGLVLVTADRRLAAYGVATLW